MRFAQSSFLEFVSGIMRCYIKAKMQIANSALADALHYALNSLSACLLQACRIE